jgi:hypothetical protein
MQESIGNGTWRWRFTPEEILDYCEGHVEALTRLLLAMLPSIDLPRALLLRGRFMAAAAASAPRPVAEPLQRDRQQSPDRAGRSVSGIRPALTGIGWKKPSNLVQEWGAVQREAVSS